jgi:hypothetical protein
MKYFLLMAVSVIACFLIVSSFVDVSPVQYMNNRATGVEDVSKTIESEADKSQSESQFQDETKPEHEPLVFRKLTQSEADLYGTGQAGGVLIGDVAYYFDGASCPGAAGTVSLCDPIDVFSTNGQSKNRIATLPSAGEPSFRGYNPEKKVLYVSIDAAPGQSSYAWYIGYEINLQALDGFRSEEFSWNASSDGDVPAEASRWMSWIESRTGVTEY